MRITIYQVLVLGVVLGMAGRVSAQTGAIVSGEVQIYNPGVDPTSGAPVQVNAIGITCNQASIAPTVTATTVTWNPNVVEFADVLNAGKVCTSGQLTAGPLLSLPIVAGNYLATVTVTDDRGLTSPKSSASNPFGRANPPAVRTALRLVRP